MWAGRKAGRTYRLGHDDVLRRFGKLLIHHERVDDVFSTALGNYGYIMRDPRLDPLLAAARDILVAGVAVSRRCTARTTPGTATRSART